jgi:hypothetical protein
MSSMKVWHYAPWAKLPAMVKAGELIPSNAGAPGEAPVLWFSANQHWEPTATKTVSTPRGPVRLTLAQQAQRFGCIRFGLMRDDPRLLSWDNACKAAGTPRDMQRTLELVGKRLGARCSDWYGCLSAIGLSELEFQVRLDTWRPALPDEMAQVWLDQKETDQ